MSSSSLSFQATGFSLSVSTIALALVVWLAWRAWSRSGWRRTILWLELLRIGVVVCAVFLLNQPEAVQKFTPTDLPTVVVLGDHSRSMETQDVEPARTNISTSGGDSPTAPVSTAVQVQSRLAALAPLMDAQTWSDADKRLRIIVQPFAQGESSIKSDLYEAMKLARDEHKNLRGLVVASDGDWNSGLPPVQMAMRLRLDGVPVFAVPLGSAVRLPDIELASFDVPTFGITGKTVRIPFTLESSLPRDHVTTITLTGSDGTQVQQEVRIAAMGRTTDAVLWKPASNGDVTLSLKVPTHPEEKLLENNSKSAPIAIREEKLKVLVIESIPRWEYRYLRNALSRDPGVEVSCLLFHPGLSKVGSGNKDYIPAFPEELEDLAKYDVVFLGDVGVQEGQLTEQQSKLLKGLVEQQASGLVFMPGFGGRQFSLLGSPLEELMPVVLDANQPQGWGSRTPCHFELTELGRRSLLTKLADSQDDNMRIWENLPGFQWYASVIRAKAGCDVLCVHQDESNAYGRLPLLVTRTFGAGKVLFMGTDGAWRWRRGVEDLYHYRFWGQVVRWMAYQRNMAKGETMRLFYTPEQPQVRQTLTLNANVMEDSGEPLAAGEVTVRIVAPSGRVENVRLESSGGEWGAFAAPFTPLEAGSHDITMQCKQTNGQLEAKLFVQGAALEAVGRPARPEVLEELARVSRGKVLDVQNTEQILKAISDIPFAPEKVRRVQLWSHPLVAAALVFMLGLFWIARKSAGLF